MKPYIDCHTHIGVDPIFFREGSFPYAEDYRTLLEQANHNGIQKLVVFPFCTYLGWNGVEITGGSAKTIPDTSVPYAFENRRLLQEVYELNSDCSDAALPFLMFDPARKQQEQVKALRELKKQYPVYGLKTQPTIIQAPIRSLLDEGRCLVELAREWDVPLLIHSSIDPNDIWSQAQDILDIAEAWPEVRVCLAHSCRFDRPSLERIGSLPNTWFDCSAHCIHCDAAVDNLAVVATPENRVKADYSRPEHVMRALYEMLPDRMMWGSDAPFYSYAAVHDGKMLRLLSSYVREVAALSLLNEAEKTAILHDNTLRFLKLANG